MQMLHQKLSESFEMSSSIPVTHTLAICHHDFISREAFDAASLKPSGPNSSGEEDATGEKTKL